MSQALVLQPNKVRLLCFRKKAFLWTSKSSNRKSKHSKIGLQLLSKHLSWLQMPSWHSAVLLAKAKQAWALSHVKQLLLKQRGTTRTNQLADDRRREIRQTTTKNTLVKSKQNLLTFLESSAPCKTLRSNFTRQTGKHKGHINHLASDTVRRQSERAFIMFVLGKEKL